MAGRAEAEQHEESLEHLHAQQRRQLLLEVLQLIERAPQARGREPRELGHHLGQACEAQDLEQLGVPA